MSVRLIVFWNRNARKDWYKSLSKRFLGAAGIPQTAEWCMSAGVANTPSAILSYVSMWKFLRTREKCQRTTSRQFRSVVYSMYSYTGRRSLECFIIITFASRTSLYFYLGNMQK